jgi:hypothetical protein
MGLPSSPQAQNARTTIRWRSIGWFPVRPYLNPYSHARVEALIQRYPRLGYGISPWGVQ